MTHPRYTVITPARNEEENLPHTIKSMAAQTILPVRWIIVNDGSTDATARIIEEAAAMHPWITPLHRPDRGFRKQGGGVIDTFYEGYTKIEDLEWDFLVKFDADLSFAPDFFQRCLAQFEQEPTLGIGGGLICHEAPDGLRAESAGDPPFHVRGATKIYRRSCWDTIGGLMRAPGWDTIDEMKANMLGWTTRTFRDIPLRHHRFCGSADGTWKNYVKFGLSNYITGYHPIFMLLKSIKRLLQRPYLIGSVGLLYGYARGVVQRTERVNDHALIGYVRRQQINAILLRPSLWSRR